VSYRIGTDIGGTFTDFTVIMPNGEVVLWKEDSTPDNPVEAVEKGLKDLGKELGVESLVSEAELFVHGTTRATNMLIQRNGPRIGLLCTEGFRDVLYLRDGFKPDRFNIHLKHPDDLIERWLRIGIPERLDHHGDEVAPLDEDAVRRAAAHFRDADVQAVAIAFMWSIVNPAHELRAAEILAEELPGVHVVCSHVVLPEIREWERTSATALSAYILPTIAEYLSELEGYLQARGCDAPPLIMQINGGCARIPEIIRQPVSLLGSGPAAAPAAAMYYADSIGDNLITVDMGGTSLDVCLIRNGRQTLSRDIQVEDQPIGIPAVEVHSIGAGGGSIAWIDDGGALRVGPKSAGARPGPACYDQGGTEPTVTDANVVLGYLEPEAFLGGRRTLRDDLSREAVERRIGEPLGLSVTEAAAGIARIVNANMVGAIRLVSIERGIDPRGFTLVCGGGAGGLHAVELARELKVGKVFVPVQAGTFCAFGMTVTDVKHDYSALNYQLSSETDLSSVNATLEELERQARSQLEEEGFSADQITLERSADARYPGQVHELTVPVPSGRPIGDEELAELEAGFHHAHQEQFAYNRDGLAIEVLHWRVTATGKLPLPTVEQAAAEPSVPTPTGTREAYVASLGEMVETPTYLHSSLSPGDRIEGPAVIQAATTTVVIGPGDELTVRADHGMEIAVASGAPAGQLSAAASTHG
jgi:N-methylhydantoinase A